MAHFHFIFHDYPVERQQFLFEVIANTIFAEIINLPINKSFQSYHLQFVIV